MSARAQGPVSIWFPGVEADTTAGDKITLETTIRMLNPSFSNCTDLEKTKIVPSIYYQSSCLPPLHRNSN